MATLVFWGTVVCVHNIEWNCVLSELNEVSQTIVMKNVIVLLTSTDCVSKKQPFIAIINNCCVAFIFHLFNSSHFSNLPGQKKYKGRRDCQHWSCPSPLQKG